MSRTKSVIEDNPMNLLKRENSDIHISRAHIRIDKKGDIRSESEFQFVKSVSDMSEVMSQNTRRKLASSAGSMSKESMTNLPLSTSTKPSESVVGLAKTSTLKPDGYFKSHSTLSADGVLELGA